MLKKDLLLKCRTNEIDIRQPAWVGYVLAFLALCKVGFCVSALCALQCAKNRVGSGEPILVSIKSYSSPLNSYPLHLLFRRVSKASVVYRY